MKRFTLVSTLALLMLSACAPSAEAIQTAIAQTPAAGGPSDRLTRALDQLLQEGATLSAMTIQGVTFSEYRQQLARVKGAFSVALSAQSPSRNMPSQVVEEMNQAFTGWDLALSVWDAKQNGGAAPRAPDVGRYPELVTYIGLEQLPMVGSGSESSVDQNQVIRILLSLARDHYMAVQDMVLQGLQ